MNIKTLAATTLLCVSFASGATEITTHSIGKPLFAHYSSQGYSLTVFSGDCVVNNETQDGAKPVVLRMPDGVDRLFDLSNLPFVKLQNS